MKEFSLNDFVITPGGVGIIVGRLTRKNGKVEYLVSPKNKLVKDVVLRVDAYRPEMLTRLVPEAR